MLKDIFYNCFLSKAPFFIFLKFSLNYYSKHHELFWSFNFELKNYVRVKQLLE